MKYKGIELTEVTEPQLFDPPNRMLVWDSDDDFPTERTSITARCADVNFLRTSENGRT